MIRRSLAIATMAVVSGCSAGGASSSGATSVAVVPAPTPTPTPTPTPSPTPSATTASYDAASDFNRDRSFTAVGVRTVGVGTSLTSTIDPLSSEIGFDYIAATNQYRVRYNGVQAAAVTTRTQNVYEVDYYRDASRSSPDAEKLLIARSAVFGTRYVGYLYFVDGNDIATKTLGSDFFFVSNPAGLVTQRRLVFGARTVGTELPATGENGFAGLAEFTYLLSGVQNGGASDDTTLTIDWAARRITGTIFARRASGSAGSSFQPPLQFPFTASFTADGHITSTAAASGPYALVDGYFYGPAGAELGFVFRYFSPRQPVGSGENFEYVGVVVAKRS